MQNEEKSFLNNGVKEFLSNSLKTFESILNVLDSISAISEQQFSKISGNLQIYYSKSKEISEKGSEIVLLLSGDQYNNNIENLQKIYVNIFDSIDKSQKKFETSEAFFNEIIKSINVVAEDVLGFKRLVKYLHIQGISTKIESSRLGSDDKGFNNLAENVENLSIVISDKSSKFRVETESLINLIRNVQYEDINIKRTQQENSKTILNNAKASLNLLIDKNRQSSVKYEIVYSNFQEIQGNIGTLVTSVQFHDITRQQFQHVHAAFQNLMKKISSAASMGFKDSEQLLNTIYDICKIQYEQLKHSRDELFSATKEIIDNLTSINENIFNMTREISGLLDDNGNYNQSFIENIKQGLKNVSASLSSSSNLGLNFSNSTNKVINTIESLAGFINEIGEIGSEIELISLNANIKAVHLGEEGATLAVIAGEIQKLSIDARKETDIVIQKILKVNEFSKSFDDSLNQNCNESVESKKTIEEFNNILNSLNTIIGEAASGLTIIQKSAKRLLEDLILTIKTITVHTETEKKINQILKQVEFIIEKSNSLKGTKLRNNSELSDLSMNYTMQSQRNIHNSVTSEFNETDFNIKPDNTDNISGGSDEFGDNVELF